MAKPAEDIAGAAPEVTASSTEASDSSESIYKVDTVPPPDGADDAYSAATRVGPMAHAFVEQLMARAEELNAPPPSNHFSPISEVRSVPIPKPARLPSMAPPSRAEPSAAASSARAPAPVDNGELPRLLEEGPEGDRFEETEVLHTMLSPAAPGAPARAAGHAAAPVVIEEVRYSTAPPRQAAGPFGAPLMAPSFAPHGPPSSSPASRRPASMSPASMSPASMSPAKRSAGTLRLEIIIFAISFLVIAIPAIYVLLRGL